MSVTLSTKINQIVVTNGKPFGFEGQENESAHGHVGLVSEARELDGQPARIDLLIETLSGIEAQTLAIREEMLAFNYEMRQR